jgi:hypothetical protein
MLQVVGTVVAGVVVVVVVAELDSAAQHADDNFGADTPLS